MNALAGRKPGNARRAIPLAGHKPIPSKSKGSLKGVCRESNKRTTVATLLVKEVSQREIARLIGVDRKPMRSIVRERGSPKPNSPRPPGPRQMAIDPVGQIPPPRPQSARSPHAYRTGPSSRSSWSYVATTPQSTRTSWIASVSRATTTASNAVLTALCDARAGAIRPARIRPGRGSASRLWRRCAHARARQRPLPFPLFEEAS
jgi:hypothetical protein